MADEPKAPDIGPTFELKLVSISGPLRAGQVASAGQQTNPHTEHRRNSQERGRKLADEYADEMLLINVHLARTSTDENIRLRATKQVMDRAWGLTKALSEEEKKGADAGSILDVLAAVSIYEGNKERQAPGAPAIEHSPTNPEDSLERLLDDLNTEDAVIVDG